MTPTAKTSRRLPRALAWLAPAQSAPSSLASALLLAVTTLPAPALAGDGPARAPERGVLSLNASATTEVAHDWLTVTFSTTVNAADAATVQKSLRKALEPALDKARAVAKPGQIEVQTGEFTVNPRYDENYQKIAGWAGTASLIVQGRDSAAISELVGQISSLTVAGANWSLSRQQREKVEAELASRAIQSFRERAGRMAQDFGYDDIEVREVSVQSGQEGYQPMYSMARVGAAPMAMAEKSLPTESGKGEVTVTVSGSVQMLK
jgi:predicted secreted protein